MSKACTHFAYLTQRISSLIATFLSDQIENESADPLNFTPEPDKLAAFRLLAHAEFEEFLEKKAKEGLKNLETKGAGCNYLIRNMPELLLISSLLGEKLLKSNAFDQIEYIKCAESVLKKAREKIDENNGIKEESFFRLSIFSGLMADEIDQTLSSTLNSYGKGRGDVAHKSVSGVRTLQAPSVEANTAKDIVNSLQVFFGITP